MATTARIIAAATLAVAVVIPAHAARTVGEHINHSDNTVGSFTQWSEDVAVTAGQNLEDALYQSPCLDIQFFKNKGMPVPHKADVQIGDQVVAVGKTTRRPAPQGSVLVAPVQLEIVTTEVEGTITSRVGTSPECGIEYLVMSGMARPGMAGGPVYGPGDSVVGIVKGTVDYQGTRGTLIIPRAAIEKAWKAAQLATQD